MSATQVIELTGENSGALLRFEFDGSDIMASIQTRGGQKLVCEVSQEDRLSLNKFLATCVITGRKQDT